MYGMEFMRHLAPKLIVLSGPTFVAGVAIENDVVMRTAPIVNYMMGWKAERVRSYARHRGWQIEEFH